MIMELLIEVISQFVHESDRLEYIKHWQEKEMLDEIDAEYILRRVGAMYAEIGAQVRYRKGLQFFPSCIFLSFAYMCKGLTVGQVCPRIVKNFWLSKGIVRVRKNLQPFL